VRSVSSLATEVCLVNGGETAKVIQVEIASQPMRPFFTVASLAVYLGLSERTITDWLRDGILPSYKIGGARRIDPADVDAYLAQHRQEKAA